MHTGVSRQLEGNGIAGRAVADVLILCLMGRLG